MTLEPISLALQIGFLAVLYLFLLWVSRSALRDLRRPGVQAFDEAVPDGTGMHPAASGLAPAPFAEPRLRVEHAAGLRAGDEYDLSHGALLGRGGSAEIRIDDPFASSRHCRITMRGDVLVIEDLGSTNGTFLNDEALSGPQPLHPGDRIRIGDNEFSFLA